jgi:hypothetical protein
LAEPWTAWVAPEAALAAAVGALAAGGLAAAALAGGALAAGVLAAGAADAGALAVGAAEATGAAEAAEPAAGATEPAAEAAEPTTSPAAWIPAPCEDPAVPGVATGTDGSCAAAAGRAKTTERIRASMKKPARPPQAHRHTRRDQAPAFDSPILERMGTFPSTARKPRQTLRYRAITLTHRDSSVTSAQVRR